MNREVWSRVERLAALLSDDERRELIEFCRHGTPPSDPRVLQAGLAVLAFHDAARLCGGQRLPASIEATEKLLRRRAEARALAAREGRRLEPETVEVVA